MARNSTRSVVVSALLISFGLLALEAGIVLGLVREADRRSTVSAERLLVALQTFRPSERAGRARRVPRADLAPERSVRSDPPACAALSLLSTGRALDGASWTGISGRPVQPVTILSVRFSDANDARAALWEKRLALLGCRSVRLTFPPFDEPAREFAVTFGAAALSPDQVSYGLSSGSDRYGFYVRRWGSTLTWTYDRDRERVRVSRRVVDDLVNRLEALSRE